jgi:hypothetical protein
MSNPEGTLISLLTAAPSLVPLLGGRVSPDRADPTTVTPFVALTRADTETMQSMVGAVENPDVVFDVHVWGSSRAQANTAADTLIDVVQAAGIYIRTRESGYSDELGLHGCLLKVVID